jgi:hypothetical protein
MPDTAKNLTNISDGQNRVKQMKYLKILYFGEGTIQQPGALFCHDSIAEYRKNSAAAKNAPVKPSQARFSSGRALGPAFVEGRQNSCEQNIFPLFRIPLRR